MPTFDINRLSKPMLADYQDYAKTGEDAIYWLVASKQTHTTDQIINRMQSSTIERTALSGLKTLGEWSASQYGPTQIRATLAPVSNTNKYSSFALLERGIQIGKLRYPLRHSFAATKPAFVKKTYATYMSMLRTIKQQYGIEVVETARFNEMFRYTHTGKFSGFIKNPFEFTRLATPNQNLSERRKLEYQGTIYLNNTLRLANGVQYEISQQEKMTKVFDAIFEVSVNQYAKERPENGLTEDEKFVARLIADVLMSRAIDFGDAEDNINAETSLTLQLANVLAYLELSPDRLKVCGAVGLTCAQDACIKMGLDINKVMQGMQNANHTYKKTPLNLAEALAPINKPFEVTIETVEEKPEVVIPKKPSPIDELAELLDTSKEDKEKGELAEKLARLIQRVSDKKQEQERQDEQRRKQEEAARLAAEAEALRLAEEKRKQEEAERLAAEQEAQRKAEEEEKRRLAEEEARRKAEEERLAQQRKLEEEARRLAEERKKLEQEQARLKAEEEARKKAEAEAKRKAEEEAKRQAEERRKQAEAARIAAEAEAKRKAEEEERRKQEEAKKEEERKRLEEENRRLKAEEEARKKAEEEEAKKKIGKKSVLFGIKDKIYLKRKSAADYFDKIILKSISSATDTIVKSRYAPSVSKKKADLLDRQYNFLDHMMSFYNKNKLTGNAEQIERELTSEHGIADNNVAHAFANAFIELREHILDQIFAQEDKIEKPDGKSIATIINECVEEKFGSKLSTFVNDQIKREIKEIFKQIDMNAYKATSFIDDDNSLDTSSHNQSE